MKLDKFVSVGLAALMLAYALACNTPAGKIDTDAVKESAAISPTAAQTAKVDSVETTVPTAAVETEQPEATVTPEIDENLRGRVLTVNDGSYGYSEIITKFDVDVVVTQKVVDTKSGDHKTFEFAGHTYDLVYADTRSFTFGNANRDEYSLADNSLPGWGGGDGIAFAEDGSLVMLDLLDHRIHLDVGENPNVDNIRAAVKAFMKEWIAFDHYEFCETIEPDSEEDNDYACYTFRWLNKKNDIKLADSAYVMISPDGDLMMAGISPYSIDVNKVPDDTSIDRYMPEFEQKLNELYGDKLVSYELIDSNINTYQDELCLRVWFTVRVNADDSEEPIGEIVSLAIIL